jgi:hypothetical protein
MEALGEGVRFQFRRVPVGLNLTVTGLPCNTRRQCRRLRVTRKRPEMECPLLGTALREVVENGGWVAIGPRPDVPGRVTDLHAMEMGSSR